MNDDGHHGDLEIITDAKGIGESRLSDFQEAGYESAEEVGRATPSELANEVSGIGYTTAIKVLKYLEKKGYRDTSNRDDELERLVELLQELFEFENSDRDFGVYKLMNANREKIEEYIKEDLVDKIEEEVSKLHEEFDIKSREEVREEVVDELGAEAFDGDSLSEKALEEIERRAKGAGQQELEDARSEIYNHAYQFFSNYYESGDFITRRRRTHQSEPYSVPYDGSNTHFHWVTKNQYYAKTSEQFTRFTFPLNNYQICFNTIPDEIEGDGIGNSEYFVMSEPSDIRVEKDSIVIPFYRRMINDEDLDRFNDISSNTHNKQSAMNDTFADELKLFLDQEGIRVARDDIANKIDEYTTRNQNDFFIHKNIEKFLINELEEYVKSEIVKFDPHTGMESMSDLSIEKGRIVTEIATDIISFVSQLEEFKRKIFEKKKFVKNSKELVQLKNIPTENYQLILDNDDQISEWEESFDINGDELDTENLTEYPYNQMIVDTSYFKSDISTGEEPQNKLIKGDNYQALKFLEERYENNVKCIYIDPPYNTGNANFAYKDKYKRPTWLSMMYERLEKAKDMLKNDGIIFISIDQHENHNLKNMANEIFGEENLLQELVWDLNTGFNRGHFKRSHEYILAYCKDKEELSHFNLSDSISTLRDFDSKYIIHNAVKSVDKNGRFSKISFTEGDIEYKGGDAVFEKGTNIGSEREPLTVVGNDAVFENGILKSRTEFEANWSMRNQLLDWLENGVTYDSKGQKVESFFIPESGGMKYKKVRDGINPKSVLKGFPSGGRDEIENVFGYAAYDYPKPPILVKELLALVTEENDIVLDFFAGSGTTAQAVHELNRERDETINYVLVEMLNEAFDITEERVKRTSYAKEWSDGNPEVSDKYNEESELDLNVECLELETYEEALDAIEFNNVQETIGAFNDTLLNYLLEFGTKDSPVLLDSEQLAKPLEYELDGSIKSKPIDVMKTFNYLIGLKNWGKGEITISGVDYTTFAGCIGEDHVLVVWRHDADNISYDEEATALNTEKYDRVYINGDSVIDNSQPIAPVFSRKMIPNKGDVL